MYRSNACLLLVLVLGCAGENGPRGDVPGKEETQNDPAALAAGKKFLLTTEPGGARGVIEVRGEAKDGDEVVVVGRVGGERKPFTAGRASFVMVDVSLPPSETCRIPWDYCEVPGPELAAARITIKFVDRDGQTLRASARDIFGIQELSTVVVKGQARRDPEGNLVVVASGLYVREHQAAR